MAYPWGMPKMDPKSMVRGLRLEPDLAKALVLYAETQAKAHGGAPVNMAATVRTLLREALGVVHGEHNCKSEGYFRGLAEARKKIAGVLK